VYARNLVFIVFKLPVDLEIINTPRYVYGNQYLVQKSRNDQKIFFLSYRGWEICEAISWLLGVKSKKLSENSFFFK